MKQLLSGWGATWILLVAATAAIAQEAPEAPKPEKEHAWLQQFVGEWETEAEANMGPGQPPMKCTGKFTGRMLGGLWMISETKTQAFGIEIDAIQTLGYDPQAKKYIGSWVDSVYNHMWRYDGTVDPTGKILTLVAEGPNMTKPGTTAKFRDVYEFKSPDLVATSSGMLGEDGQWVEFMTGQMKRKK